MSVADDEVGWCVKTNSGTVEEWTSDGGSCAGLKVKDNEVDGLYSMCENVALEPSTGEAAAEESASCGNQWSILIYTAVVRGVRRAYHILSRSPCRRGRSCRRTCWRVGLGVDWRTKFGRKK